MTLPIHKGYGWEGRVGGRNVNIYEHEHILKKQLSFSYNKITSKTVI